MASDWAVGAVSDNQMHDGPEPDLIEVLWDSIKEGFRKPQRKGRRTLPTQSKAARVGNALIITGFLALLLGGVLALFALMRASSNNLGPSAVKSFFFVGAGIGTVIGLVYVFRAWRSGDDL